MGGCGCEKERELRGQEWSEGSCESWEWPGGGDVFVDENGCWGGGGLLGDARRGGEALAVNHGCAAGDEEKMGRRGRDGWSRVECSLR